MRHTKIIATVGPATDSDAMLDAIIAAGTDIIRLNFSHGTHETQGATYVRARAAVERSGRQVAILQDLSGPKIRPGRLEDGRPIELKPGALLRIATGDFVGDASRIAGQRGLAHIPGGLADVDQLGHRADVDRLR